MKKEQFSMMRVLSVFTGILFLVSYAFADSGVVAPQDFFVQVLEVIKVFGGLSTMLKISAVITLLVASMKVSFMNDLIWSKLGAAKVYVAPTLGLIGGILGVGVEGPVTAASIFAFVTAGAGAVFLHEILDSVKAIPGIGAIYITIINLIQGALGGPKKA